MSLKLAECSSDNTQKYHTAQKIIIIWLWHTAFTVDNDIPIPLNLPESEVGQLSHRGARQARQVNNYYQIE